MALKPVREHATNNSQTYFVTSKTWEGRFLFRAESFARLFFKTLLLHRGRAYLLHEFVLMPDHFHLLITPLTSLERVVQLIKGGFSFRAKKELGSRAEIWQRGFADHRIRDDEDYEKHMRYIHLNPVKRHLCSAPHAYRYSSAYPGWKLDPVPPGLKPGILQAVCGTAEAVPFQNTTSSRRREAVTSQNEHEVHGPPKPLRLQNPAQSQISAQRGAIALKGHDFSRAAEDSVMKGALAPEGGRR